MSVLIYKIYISPQRHFLNQYAKDRNKHRYPQYIKTTTSM